MRGFEQAERLQEPEGINDTKDTQCVPETTTGQRDIRTHRDRAACTGPAQVQVRRGPSPEMGKVDINSHL